VTFVLHDMDVLSTQLHIHGYIHSMLSVFYILNYKYSNSPTFCQYSKGKDNKYMGGRLCTTIQRDIVQDVLVLGRFTCSQRPLDSLLHIEYFPRCRSLPEGSLYDLPASGAAAGQEYWAIKPIFLSSCTAFDLCAEACSQGAITVSVAV